MMKIKERRQATKKITKLLCLLNKLEVIDVRDYNENVGSTIIDTFGVKFLAYAWNIVYADRTVAPLIRADHEQ